MEENYVEIYRLDLRTQPLRRPRTRRLREGDVVDLQTGTWMTVGLKGRIYKELNLTEIRWPWLEFEAPEGETLRFHIMHISWVKRRYRKRGPKHADSLTKKG